MLRLKTMRTWLNQYLLALILGASLTVSAQERQVWLANVSSTAEMQTVALPAGSWGLPTDGTSWWRDLTGQIADPIRCDESGVYLRAALPPMSVIALRLAPATDAGTIDDGAPPQQSSPFVGLVREENGQFAGRHGPFTITVRDDNADQAPDMLGDRWLIQEGHRACLGFTFFAPITDPLRRAHAVHVSVDADASGTIEEQEWQRPRWRLEDRSGGGAFLHGNLLTGGDAVATTVSHAPEGSPDGRWWDSVATVYDLDNDGDGDLMVEERHIHQQNRLTTHRVHADTGDDKAAFTVRIDPVNSTLYFQSTAAIQGDYLPLRQGALQAEREEWLVNELWTYRIDDQSAALTQLGGSGFQAGLAPPIQSIQLGDKWGHAPPLNTRLIPSQWKGDALSITTHWPHLAHQYQSFKIVGRDDGQTARHEKILPGTPPWLYWSPALDGYHAGGAISGVSSNGMHYYDEDGNGFIDHYVYRDVHENQQRVRSLYVLPATRELMLRQGDKAVVWREEIDMKKLAVTPDNLAKLELGTSRGEPLVMRLALDRNGRLPGYPATAVQKPGIPLLMDGWHANRKLVAESTPIGLLHALPPLDRHGFTTIDQVTPLENTSLPPDGVVVMTHFARGPGEEEMRLLRAWVAMGGTLILAPAESTEPQRIAMNAVLEALGVKARYSRERTVPIDALTDTTGRLLDGSTLPALGGFAVTGADRPLLLHDKHVLLGWHSLSAGRIYLAGFPFMSNLFYEPDSATSHLRLLSNFLAMLKEEVQR